MTPDYKDHILDFLGVPTRAHLVEVGKDVAEFDVAAQRRHASYGFVCSVDDVPDDADFIIVTSMCSDFGALKRKGVVAVLIQRDKNNQSFLSAFMHYWRIVFQLRPKEIIKINFGQNMGTLFMSSYGYFQLAVDAYRCSQANVFVRVCVALKHAIRPTITYDKVVVVS